MVAGDWPEEETAILQRNGEHGPYRVTPSGDFNFSKIRLEKGTAGCRPTIPTI
jgi:hypothetical protein